MRIAVTASGPGLQSRFEPCFSSAAYFVLYDTPSRQVQWRCGGAEFESPPGDAELAVQELAKLDIDVLVTGHVSLALARHLDAAGIRLCQHRWATVIDALEEFIPFEPPPGERRIERVYERPRAAMKTARTART